MITGLDFVCVDDMLMARDQGACDEAVVEDGPRGEVLHYVVSEAVEEAVQEDDPDYEQGPHLGRVTRYREGGREVLNRLVETGAAELRSRGYWVQVHGYDVYANRPF